MTVGSSEQEMLASIIQWESHGDPWATNGPYKGIGQLNESYYPKYVGMTWEQCAGNYDIQYTAMYKYIMAVYGSVEGAYNHHLAYHWY
ncbi:MAG: hypothetical protein LBU41_04610 [Clostridiales Family XIII bacterium]|nr:hypothetical protein [Clostridiales Family XIII bacterium]